MKTNNFRVSGYIDGEPCQVDVEAENKTEAKVMAESDYGFDSIHNVTLVKPSSSDE